MRTPDFLKDLIAYNLHGGNINMPDFKWPGELHSIPPRATTPQLVQLSPDTPALFPSCSRPSNQMCRARLKRTDQRCGQL